MMRTDLHRRARALLLVAGMAWRMVAGALRSAYHVELAVLTLKEEVERDAALRAALPAKAPEVAAAPAVEQPLAEVIPFPGPTKPSGPSTGGFHPPAFIKKERVSIAGPYIEYLPTFRWPKGGLDACPPPRAQFPN